MSVEHMLRDTSIASTTVVRLVGTAMIAAGRAIARTRLAEPEREQRERQVPADPRRARRGLADQRQAREAHAGARPAERPDADPDEDRQRDEQHEQLGPQERHGIRPNQRSDPTPPTSSSRNPSPARIGVSSNGSVRTTKSTADVLVDRRQVGLVRGRVVRAVGHRRDRLERRLVELGVDHEPLDFERGPGRAADTDRVDPDAKILRGLGRLERVGPRGVLAVGQQHDDRRVVHAGGDRGRSRLRWRRLVRVVVGLVGVLVRLDRCERGEDPLPDRGAALRREPLDRGDGLDAVAGRHLGRQPGVAEHDDADPNGRRLRLDELECRGLGRLHPGRGDVGRGHAPRHVEREEDRALHARHADHALRPREREHEDRDAGDRAGPPARADANERDGRLRPPAPADEPPHPNCAARVARRRSRDRYAHTPSGTASRSSRSGGQMNDTASA